MSKKIKITESQLKSLLEQLEGGDQDQRISKASEPEFKTFDDILQAVGKESGVEDGQDIDAGVMGDDYDEKMERHYGVEDESIEDLPVQESIKKIKESFKRFL